MEPLVIQGAGILFLTPDKKALFIQRSPNSDHPGEWCVPGGKLEKDETFKEAARREAAEEIGNHPGGDLLRLSRTRRVEVASPETTPSPVGQVEPPLVPTGEVPAPIIDFVTYVQQVDKEFEIQLDGTEHTAFTWAPITNPPQPLHPGVGIAVMRMTMNELDVAEAIRDGLLTSGQRFGGMALFAMRITGTGTAYRRGRKEYVYRKPEFYLNERFLQRCNGLPVIIEHPEKSDLNSEEFQERAVGTIVLPYIVGDEVWGIAKIYDTATIKMLETNQLSTSPSVVFRDPSNTNTKVKLDDGQVLLIEGEPSLLDHLAICPKGVWDKGGEPRGIAFEAIGDTDMTDEEKKALEEAEAKKKADAEEAKRKEDEEKAKKDAEAGEKLDKVLTCLDSLTSRMDAWDEKEKKREDSEAEEARRRGDEEQAKKDKAKKDAEEAEAAAKAEKDRKDADEERKRQDSETRAAIEKLAQAMPKQLSDEDYNAMADAQARADSVLQLHSRSAPRPLQGEDLLGYRRRLASQLKGFSAAWKDVDLSTIADATAFKNIEDVIYNDAETAGRNPVDIPVDTLRSHTRPDQTGRQITTFQGRPGAWMRDFSGHRRRLAGIRNS